GLLDRRSGTVQPLSLARGLAAAAAAKGARLFGQARVTRLVRQAPGWLAETATARVTARQVLLATNAYLDGLCPALKTAMIPVESYQIATEPLSGDLGRHVLPGGLPVSDLMQLG